MQTGSYFGQGHTHLVCQDYALNGKDFAILSDGCSNGGGPNIHTDFGSRLLCKAAEEHLDKLAYGESFLPSVCSTAQTQQRGFPNLPEECLTATLMVLSRRNSATSALLVGDGVIAARRKVDKLWEVHNYEFVRGGEFERSAPYYLRYEMANKVQEYYSYFGGVAKRQTYIGDFKPQGDNELEFADETEIDLKKTSPHFKHTFDNGIYDLVVGMSDGATSFYEMVRTETKKFKRPVGLLRVLPILLDFSDFQPGFVERQCSWVFKRDVPNTFLRLGWINADDFSMGAIYDGD